MHGRRCLLHAAAALGLAWLGPVAAAAPAGRSSPRAGAEPAVQLAAAWDDAAGRHFVGVLAAGAGGALRVAHAIEVPTRAHGLLVEADGAMVAMARRPGEWMLRLHPGRPARSAQWCWSDTDRRFCGHVVRAADGSLLSTETDLGSGAGLLVRRDAKTFDVRNEWPTHGIDPHELLVDADGSILVANGGVPTRPETGRAKLDRTAIDSSLVRLHPDGSLLGQWRLPDPQLSIRHLARHAGGVVGVALQAEHDDAQARAQAPLLALFDGERLRSVGAPAALAGYGGAIAATAGGFAVAATRAGRVTLHGHDGTWRGEHRLAEACALAAADRILWAGGAGQALQCAAGADIPAAAGTDAPIAAGRELQRQPGRSWPVPGLRLDNHWALWPGPVAARRS